MVFKYGFYYFGFKYGFIDNKLFRLPIEKDGRQYPLREVPRIKLSETGIGYRLVRQKKSLAQVESMLEKVNWKINKVECVECFA